MNPNRIHSISGPGLCLAAVILAAGCATNDPATRSAIEKKWATDLAAFDAADAQSPPQPGGLLLVGSSSFRKWTNVAESFPERHVTNRGFGGSQMYELLALTDRLVWPYSPSEILVYEGDNDVALKKSPEQIADAFEEFAQRVHRRLPQARMYFVSIKPSPSRVKLWGISRRANELVAAYCARQPWLKFIDVATSMLNADGLPRKELFGPDNLHLNGDGYVLWTKIIRKELGLN